MHLNYTLKGVIITLARDYGALSLAKIPNPEMQGHLICKEDSSTAILLASWMSPILLV
jgi:hypothetical protein